MGDFLREELNKRKEQKETPAEVKEEPQPEDKQYASMKQRKKAERLARKHAAAQTAAQSAKTANRAEASRSLQSGDRFGLKIPPEFWAPGEVIEPCPIPHHQGALLPERA